MDPDLSNPDRDTDPDPAFQVNPDPDPGDDQKLAQITAEKKLSFFDQNFNKISLGILKGHPSYRRSLQPSKENIQHFNP